MKRFFIFLLLILSLTFTLAFSEALILTSIPPIGYAFQQIGGKDVKVMILIHAGDNPHTYTLSPRQVMNISKADVFAYLGLKEEAWIAQKVKAINPSVDIVNATSGLKRFLIGNNDNYNPHVWLDVKLYEMMCVNIYHALANEFPSNSSYFARNFAKLIEELENLNVEISKEMKPFEGRPFVAQHPAWDYFARAYGLGKEYSLENNSGQPITPREYENTLIAMKKYDINYIIGDPVTPSKISESLAAQSGAKIIEVNPIYIYNYIDLMKDIAKKFTEALRK